MRNIFRMILTRKRCWEILETNGPLGIISKLLCVCDITKRSRDDRFSQRIASYATETKSRSDARYLWQVGDAIFIVRLHRSSARLGKRRSALHNAPLCSAARARIAGSWQSGACYVQRAENSCALAFFSLSVVSVSLFRARSFQLPRRLLSPSLADRPENGPWLRGLVFTPRRSYFTPWFLAQRVPA